MINPDTVIPIVGALLVTIGSLVINNRKSRVEAAAISAVTASGTAKAEHDIWEAKFNLIVGALERRVEEAEKSEDDMRKQLMALEVKYEDCSKRLSLLDRAKEVVKEAAETASDLLNENKDDK